MRSEFSAFYLDIKFMYLTLTFDTPPIDFNHFTCIFTSHLHFANNWEVIEINATSSLLRSRPLNSHWKETNGESKWKTSHYFIKEFNWDISIWLVQSHVGMKWWSNYWGVRFNGDGKQRQKLRSISNELGSKRTAFLASQDLKTKISPVFLRWHKTNGEN